MAKFFKNPKKVVILVVLSGLVLTGIIVWRADLAARRKLEANFNEQALLRSEVIFRALESDVKVLEGLGRFFENNCHIEKQEFCLYAQQSLTRFQTIGWLPFVSQNNREIFEERVRREGGTDFQISENDSQGRLARAAGRAGYFPVYFLESQGGREIETGFDFGSDLLMRRSIEKARDTGKPVATESIVLAREGGNQEHIVIFFLPVYDAASLVSSEEERRSAFKGVLLGVFNIEYVFQDALKDTPRLGLNTTLFDRSAPPDKNVIYAFYARLQGENRFYYPALRFEHDFKFGQRDWRVVVIPSPGFLEKNLSLYHWLFLPVGILLTALVAFVAYSFIFQRRRLEGLVLLRTAELRESEGRLSQIVQGSSVATFVINNDHIVIHWNRACENLTGIAASEVVGTNKQWKAFYPAERPVMADLIVNGIREEILGRYYGNKYRKSTLIEGACEAEDFFPHMRQEGGKWFFFTAAPLKDAGGNVIGAIETLQDITERKLAEEELARIAAIKSEFTSVVSHELRIPLSAIKEGIGIVMDGSAGAVSNEQKEFLNTAKRNVDRLSRLINDVLDYQRLDAGRMEYDIRENDMNELIREVIDTMRPLAEKKYLDLTADLAAGLSKVNFDRDKIAQVLNNLVNNAIKFTEKGAIFLSTRENENSVVVCVKDTGVGIKKEDMDKLFQSFSQILTGKDRKVGGTGLGLAISKKIVQQHGGRIWVESEFGKWTAFYFNLPIVDRRRA